MQLETNRGFDHFYGAQAQIWVGGGKREEERNHDFFFNFFFLPVIK